MLPQKPLLVILIELVDLIPLPSPPAQRGRGRPKVYSDRLIVKALVIMIIRRLYSAYSLLAFLEQDTALTRQLRQLLTTSEGRFPCRRTWERRLAALPDTLPGLIGSLGRQLFQLLQADPAAAMDSTPLRAKGGVWHQKDRQLGHKPHSSIDEEAHWSKSGYHGWWYGWKLHLACAIGRLWLPLAAELTAANVYDARPAPQLIRQLPHPIRYVLGDTHYNDPEVKAHCRLSDRWLVTSRRGPYPHRDAGAKVRQIFHRLRTQATEPFNGLFKNIFEWGGQVPVKGLRRVRLFVLGAVLVYQLVLLCQLRYGLPLGTGIKAMLRAA